MHNRHPAETKNRDMFVRIVMALFILFIIDLTVAFATTTPSLLRLRQKLLNVFLVITLPVGLMRAQRQEVVSDGTLTYLIQCLAIAVSLGAFDVVPTRPIEVQAALLMITIAILNVPHWKVQCMTLIPAFVVSTYNATFGINGYDMILFVTPESGLEKEVVAHGRLVIIIPMTLYMVRSVTSAYADSASQMQGAVSVAKEVSEHLAEYNTKAAEATLLQYSSSKECDKDLHGVLLVIVDNLKKYKPFLPNYLVSQSDGIKTNHDVEEGGEEEDAVVVSASVEPTCSNPMQIEEMFEEGGNPKPLRPGRVLHQPQVPSDVEVVVNHNKKHQHRPSRLFALIPTERNVSYALIDYSVQNDDLVDNPQPLRAFIDKVYRYADVFKGAVHSCVGDTIHLTWNAVTPISTYQQYSVGLLQLLRASHSVDDTTSIAGQSSRVEVYGSVMTGPGECRITGTVHQTFLLHIGWRDAQQALHRYARTVKTNVVCRDTSRCIRDVTMLVDLVNFDSDDEWGRPPNAPKGSRHHVEIEVYELTTAEIKTLYGDALSRAIRQWNDKDYSEAMKSLQSVLTTTRQTQQVQQTALPSASRGVSWITQKILTNDSVSK
eukprot:PhF_6_TR23309/c0_g1_i10/m.32919